MPVSIEDSTRNQLGLTQPLILLVNKEGFAIRVNFSLNLRVFPRGLFFRRDLLSIFGVGQNTGAYVRKHNTAAVFSRTTGEHERESNTWKTSPY